MGFIVYEKVSVFFFEFVYVGDNRIVGALHFMIKEDVAVD